MREVRESGGSLTSRMNFPVKSPFPVHEVQLSLLFCTSRFLQVLDNLTSETESNYPINTVGYNDLVLKKIALKPAFLGRQAGMSSRCKSFGYPPRKYCRCRFFEVDVYFVE